MAGVEGGKPIDTMTTITTPIRTLVPVRRARLRAIVTAATLGVAVCLLSTGCVAVVAASAAGAGVAWVRGALETTLEADLDRAYRATQSALRDLEFAVVSERKSGVDAAVFARTARDKRVEVVLERTGDKSTRVSIRIGVFGDESLSLAVLERIKDAL